jgi:hypothetical protein
MTLTPEDQERYRKLAELEESPTGESTGGSDTRRGADAAAFGQQLLLGALGSEKAVTKAVGGRPNLGRKTAGQGASPAIRVRISSDQKAKLVTLKTQMKIERDSDLVRVALDEFMARHLQDS